ncbi:hypothetical protein FJY68_06005 [candidate division WOR-3 bacterium]|uniref:Uncharacterized protein n=1 Tax=candidate division WOR-3 bacterium TaxID=2052148 RepID=A0A938BU00_UNCW3|nr:hypothetical protein [candidate division WOR-3 bacterium]
MRIVVLAGLLAAVVASAADAQTPAIPSRFIHMEVVSLNVLYDPSSPNFTTPRMFAIRALKLSCSLSRFRFGLAPMEAGAFMSAGTQPVGLTTFLPLYFGYDLYRNPKRTLLCYSMVPDIYVEGLGSPSRRTRDSRACVSWSTRRWNTWVLALASRAGTWSRIRETWAWFRSSEPVSASAPWSQVSG